MEYPIGHKRRRNEGIPLLIEKFKKNTAKHYSKDVREQLLAIFSDAKKLDNMPVNEWMEIVCR